jgi:hypothetical protein
VSVIYRISDVKIVSVLYWDLGGRFLSDDLQEFIELNRRHGATHLAWHLYGHGGELEEFEVATAKE